VRDFAFRDIGVVVYDPVADRPLAASSAFVDTEPATARAPAPVPPLASAAVRGALRAADRADEPGFTTVRGPRGAELRVHALPLVVERRRLVIGVTQWLRLRPRILAEARDALLVALPLALLLATAGGYLLARQGLRPVAAMRAQAERIGAATLHERLPVAEPDDELGRLAHVFNRLLERLDEAFDQQRRFMADASHELRTPVAVVRGEAEHALAADRAAPELRDALAVVRDEGRRMTRIVDDLFLLARADAGQQPLALAELYLDDLVADCVRAVRSLAAERGVALTHESEADLQLRGDEQLLRRLVLNLLDNAIKYTPPGGRVAVAARAVDGRYEIRVGDSGPGVPREAQPHLFERFYRAGRTRADDASHTAGAGLGLAIARWIARAHGGDVRLARSDENGSEFVVEL
jgi:heavy metal sensor kinase